MLRLVDKDYRVGRCIRYAALLPRVHDSTIAFAAWLARPQTRFPMPRAALRSRDVTRSCWNPFIDIWVNHQSSTLVDTAKNMAPKTRSSAEGKRKRGEKVKEESKTETADHDETNDEAKEEKDEAKQEEAEGDEVKEDPQDEVKEEGKSLDSGVHTELILRTPNQSPQDLLTPGLASV
jgi:hypothetical protein